MVCASLCCHFAGILWTSKSRVELCEAIIYWEIFFSNLPNIQQQSLAESLSRPFKLQIHFNLPNIRAKIREFQVLGFNGLGQHLSGIEVLCHLIHLSSLWLLGQVQASRPSSKLCCRAVIHVFWKHLGNINHISSTCTIVGTGRGDVMVS